MTLQILGLLGGEGKVAGPTSASSPGEGCRTTDTEGTDHACGHSDMDIWVLLIKKCYTKVLYIVVAG